MKVVVETETDSFVVENVSSWVVSDDGNTVYVYSEDEKQVDLIGEFKGVSINKDFQRKVRCLLES